jgi:gamma-carbonic anhydrase
MSRYGRANASEAVSTTVLPPGATVPVGWVAVVIPRRSTRWASMCRSGPSRSLDFPGTVCGVTGDAPGAERMPRQVNWFASHFSDRTLDGNPRGQND